MAIHTAEVLWERGEQAFVDNRYSRKHILRFDAGIEVAGSSSLHTVPLPYSTTAAIDPEETFVCSLSNYQWTPSVSDLLPQRCGWGLAFGINVRK